MLSLEVQHTKERLSLLFFWRDLTGQNRENEALLLLDTLEDRFVNPVAIAMKVHMTRIYDQWRNREMKGVHTALFSKKEENLSTTELYFKAYTIRFLTSYGDKERLGMIRLYEICIARHFLPAYHALASCYREMNRTPEIQRTFLDILEIGVSFDCFSCIATLADVLYMSHVGWSAPQENDPVVVMCVRAARLGVCVAKDRCRMHKWAYQ